MSANIARVRATPFHTRAAEVNETNDWANRNGFTLSRAYAGTADEALAGRFRAGLIDISWRWRVPVEGPRAAEFLSRLVTRDVTGLPPGNSLKALWLSDGGGVRGAGLVARFGRESFLLVSAAPDREWVAAAAARFDVDVPDVAEAEGGLAIVGPYAAATLSRAGLSCDLEPGGFRRQFWRGLDVVLSRWGEQNGFELWCRADDAVIVWDRLMRAGQAFGLEPVGLAAADILDLEAGIARPYRDWIPASLGDAPTPAPRALGLEGLIEEAHTDFNGRSAFLAARDSEPLRMIGILIEDETPAPFTPLLRDGAVVGHSLTSAVSPTLRCAIAVAQIDRSAAEPGTALNVTLSPSMARPEFRNVAARVVALPFLAAPEPILP